MDFVANVPQYSKAFDATQIMIERLTKLAYLIFYMTNYKYSEMIHNIYCKKIMRYHGILVSFFRSYGPILLTKAIKRCKDKHKNTQDLQWFIVIVSYIHLSPLQISTILKHRIHRQFYKNLSSELFSCQSPSLCVSYSNIMAVITHINNIRSTLIYFKYQQLSLNK